MVNIENTKSSEIELSSDIKNNIINKLLEDEKRTEKGERTYTRDEMNAIIDWSLNRYV